MALLVRPSGLKGGEPFSQFRQRGPRMAVFALLFNFRHTPGNVGVQLSLVFEIKANDLMDERQGERWKLRQEHFG